jgi:DNA mismatch repair ATPase MutS
MAVEADADIKTASPSTSLSVINSRLDIVTRFVENPELKERIVILLRRSHDSQRLVQKFSLGRGDADDLLALAKTINASLEIASILDDAVMSSTECSPGLEVQCLSALTDRMHLEKPKLLARRILAAVDEEGVEEQHRIEDDKSGQMMALAQEIATAEGSNDDVAAITVASRKRKPTTLREHYANDADIAWIMKPTASKVLKKLHEDLEVLQEQKITLSEKLRERLGATSLTLRWTPGLGHICHVKGRDMKSLSEISTVSSSKSTRSFHHPDWTALGQHIDQVRIQIRAEEQRVFQNLRKQVIHNLIKLRRNATVLDELDIASSFATLAKEQNLVRPILNNGTTHIIIGGRHPTVEVGLEEQGRTFTSNDCFVGDQERVWLITGPNMAGKSTFLRQNALITIMAQAGSYIPATHAELGIVDRIFSRVGSADDLYRDQSTFMVEMLETATILRDATPRSFVIMDEIGRGTTPEDGKAVAFACLHHLYHVNQSRTLFATHFHSLADMTERMEKVGFYCTDVVEDEDGSWGYVHRLRKGVNRNSHALKVARLAGLPEAAMRIAKKVMEGN